MDRKNKYNILFNILFYILLFILIVYLLFPHTSINFRKKFFQSYSYRLNSEEIILKKGETFKLRLLGINRRMKFVSSDFKVADVNINGKVTGKKAGMAFIKVKVENRTLKCRVYVINMSKSSITISKGESEKLSVKGAKGYIRWYSSNKSVAKVNRKGKITGKSKGKATIYARTKGKTLSCKVTVK